MYLNRLKTLQNKMAQDNVTNLLISDPASIAYLVSYQTSPGERLLLLEVQQDGQLTLYLNRLFPAFDTQELMDVVTISYYSDGEAVLSKLATHLKPGRTGIDKNWPSHFLLDLMALATDFHPIQGSYLVDQLRSVKTEVEQSTMRTASAKNDQAMEALFKLIPLGLTEDKMVAHLADIYATLDCEGFSFEPIIAYGANGADPHHEINQDQPKLGDSVVIDIGSFYQGYASDMTRTVFYGQPDEESLTIYQTVRQANEAAIAMIKPGVKFSDIDLTARRIIEDAGYGPSFTHRLGHSIGREVHEFGDVSQYNDDEVKVGNVFSIEPGIYIPGKIGVRIEDLVIVTETGCEVLNHVTKEPLIFPVQQTEK